MIRIYSTGLFLLLVASLSDRGLAQQPESTLFYTLKLTEFRPTASMAESATSPTKIVGLFRQLEERQELDVIQTIRLAAFENTEGTSGDQHHLHVNAGAGTWTADLCRGRSRARRIFSDCHAGTVDSLREALRLVSSAHEDSRSSSETRKAA